MSAELALIDFFCIVEYSVLIFSMATDDGLWDLYFNKLPAVEISELIRTRHLHSQIPNWVLSKVNAAVLI